LQGLVEEELGFDAGVLLLYGLVAARENVDVFADVVDLEQAGLYAVVEVGGEVGDLVGEVNQLGFDRGALIEEVAGEFGMLIGAVVARMLDDTLANAKGEIEATVGGVALLEVFDYAEGVDVVVEAAAVSAEAGIEGALASVAEGGMANVVDQSESFGKVLIEAERSRDGAGDLRDFDGMGEAAAEVVGGAAGEDLGFACQAAEGAGLHDAFAITLEGRARRTKRRGMDAGKERIVRVSCDRASM